MAVIQVNEIWNGRTGDMSGDNSRSYSRVFRVFTNSNLDGPLTVLAARRSGVPRLGDLYISPEGAIDTGSTAKRKSANNEDEDPRIWIVAVEYDNKTTDPEAQQEQEAETAEEKPGEETAEDKEQDDPTEQFVNVSFGFQQFSKVVERDQNGKLIANSAKEPFDPPVEIDDSRPVLTVTRNEFAFNFSLIEQYKDAVNSDPFMGFGAGQVKVFNISGTRKSEERRIFWEITYEFHVRREGWKLKLLDWGTRELIANEPKNIREKDDNQPVLKPFPLNGQGQKAGAGADPAELTFTVYPEKSFAPLGLF